MSELKRRKVENEVKNTASTTRTPLRRIYDSHATMESNIQPFVKLQWVNTEKNYYLYPPLLGGSKKL